VFKFIPLLLIAASIQSAFGANQRSVDKFTYINLSTMLADWPSGTKESPYGMIQQETNGLHAEWGFSALIITETGGNKERVLFDTGKYPYTVIQNAERLGIVEELCRTKKVVLSHTHSDHTGGLIALREWIKKNKKCDRNQRKTALTQAYVSQEFFRGRDPEIYDNAEFFYDKPFAGRPRSRTDIKFKNEMEFIYDFVKRKFENENSGRFVRMNGPTEVIPGVWATGAIRTQMKEKQQYLADEGQPFVVDDQSLVIMTGEGAVVIAGCGHSGFKNTMNFVNLYMFGGNTSITAVAGGWHLFPHGPTALKGYGEFINGLGIKYFLGSHCTGIETLATIRPYAPMLTMQTAINDSVGTQLIYDRAADSRFTILGAFLNIPRTDD
jgi:7,8-dihydropterin-6-yl-methyl-4-(beta-D-ribofuranosyl)aminobenzene 5'-phosphate synthase